MEWISPITSIVTAIVTIIGAFIVVRRNSNAHERRMTIVEESVKVLSSNYVDLKKDVNDKIADCKVHSVAIVKIEGKLDTIIEKMEDFKLELKTVDEKHDRKYESISEEFHKGRH